LIQEKQNLMNKDWFLEQTTTNNNNNSNSINFHEYVMQFRGNLDSPILENALLNISSSQFQQLESKSKISFHFSFHSFSFFNFISPIANSFDLLLPLMERWIQETSTTSQRRLFGLVILIEASKKFTKIFSTIENKNTVRKIISTLDSILEKQQSDLDLGDITIDEIISLRNCLVQQ